MPKTPKPFKTRQINGNSLFRNKTTVSEVKPPRHISCQLIKLHFPEQGPIHTHEDVTPFLGPEEQEKRVSIPKVPGRRSYGLIDKKPYDDVTTCIDILKQGILATKYHYTKSNQKDCMLYLASDMKTLKWKYTVPALETQKSSLS